MRRLTARDERRRRALVDDGPKLAASTPKVESTATNRERTLRVLYASAARADQQPRATDFLPKGLWGTTLWLLLGLVVVITNVFLSMTYHGRFPNRDLPFDRIMAPDSFGSLASWTAAMMLIFASFTSSLIFSIRRHKLDDYRGRYRMWLYTTVFLVMASLDAAVGLRSAIDAGLTMVVPESASALYAHAAFAVLGGAVVARLIIEMHASRSAIAWLLAATSCYIGAGLGQAEFIAIPWISTTSITVAMFALAGHWLFVMSMVTYGSHVFLEAQGVTESIDAVKSKGADDGPSKTSLWQRVAKRSSPKDINADNVKKASRARTEREPEPRTQNPQVSRPEKTDNSGTQEVQTKTSRVAEVTDSQEEDSSMRKGKSERKKARKEKRRQRRAA